MSNSVAPKLLAEFIGTFALVFIGAGAASIVGGAAGGGITAVAFAHGLTLMIFICAYGSVSGGHFNPAVTVGVLAAGAITAAEAAGYIVNSPEVLAGGQPRRADEAPGGAHRRRAQDLEAVRHGSQILFPLVRLLEGTRRDVPRVRHLVGALVCRAFRR
jgi:Major intrinsic protein